MVKKIRDMVLGICFMIQLMTVFVFGFTNVSLPLSAYLFVWVASSGIEIYLIGDKTLI